MIPQQQQRRWFLGSFEEPSFEQISAHRVWKASGITATAAAPANDEGGDNGDEESGPKYSTWTEPIHEQPNMSIPFLLDRIGKQEMEGGRMQQRQMGVLREDPAEDMRLLMENYTVPSLASAVRDREELLQLCATLSQNEQWEELAEVLTPYRPEYVAERRTIRKRSMALSNPLDVASLELLRKGLMRMPRRVVQAHQKRAGVVVALCNVDGVPSLLLEKRSAHLRAHPDEVCLPGGMASSMEDASIVATCLREMHEEIEGLTQPVSVLGVLRCNWGEVHHLVGVAVTPVVVFVGELGDVKLRPSPDEVAEVFTIPLVSLLRRSDWIHREGFAPIFLGGPHAIWGLTGYIIERFVKDILLRYSR